KTAHMRIARRSISELEGTGIRPRGKVQVPVLVRIKAATSARGRDRLRTENHVGTLASVEEQATHVVRHCDSERASTFVAKDAVERPAGDQLVHHIVLAVLAEGEFVGP